MEPISGHDNEEAPSDVNVVVLGRRIDSTEGEPENIDSENVENRGM